MCVYIYDVYIYIYLVIIYMYIINIYIYFLYIYIYADMHICMFMLIHNIYPPHCFFRT